MKNGGRLLSRIKSFCSCKSVDVVIESTSTNGSSSPKMFNNRSVELDYELERVIGDGKTGHVYLGRHLRSNKYVAIKVITKEYLAANGTSSRSDALDNEIQILSEISSSSSSSNNTEEENHNICKLYAVYREEFRVSLVLAYMAGGEVLPKILQSPDVTSHENEIRKVIISVTSALIFLHNHEIIHRDIKCENILYESQERSRVCLVDFGIAVRSRSTDMAGTSHFMAPEVFQSTPYGTAVDIWSLGITTWYMCFGNFPFEGKFLSQIEDKIRSGEFAFPIDAVDHVSTDALDFISHLLVVEPSDRPTASMVLQHPWLQEKTSSKRSFSTEHQNSLRASIEERDREMECLKRDSSI